MYTNWGGAYLWLRADIDATLQLIDEVASNQQGLEEEEALILRGYETWP